MLRKFEYSQALDSALSTHNPLIVATVLYELRQRGDAYRIALSNRDDEQLAVLLEFLVKNLCNPKYTEPLLDTTRTVLGM